MRKDRINGMNNTVFARAGVYSIVKSQIATQNRRKQLNCMHVQHMQTG